MIPPVFQELSLSSLGLVVTTQLSLVEKIGESKGLDINHFKNLVIFNYLNNVPFTTEETKNQFDDHDGLKSGYTIYITNPSSMKQKIKTCHNAKDGPLQ